MDGKLQEKEASMNRAYHPCHFCGSEVTEKRITVDYRWGEKLIAIIENVPAGVCQSCGEQYFKADVVKEMEALVHSQEKPKEMVSIPLRELTAV